MFFWIWMISWYDNNIWIKCLPELVLSCNGNYQIDCSWSKTYVNFQHDFWNLLINWKSSNTINYVFYFNSSCIMNFFQIKLFLYLSFVYNWEKRLEAKLNVHIMRTEQFEIICPAFFSSKWIFNFCTFRKIKSTGKNWIWNLNQFIWILLKIDSCWKLKSMEYEQKCLKMKIYPHQFLEVYIKCEKN